MHRLRMTLACHEETELTGCFKRLCKLAGPSAPPSRRDPALPVWWTTHRLLLHPFLTVPIPYAIPSGYYYTLSLIGY